MTSESYKNKQTPKNPKKIFYLVVAYAIRYPPQPKIPAFVRVFLW